MRAALGAISTPHLARNYHRPNGLFSTVIGRIQARTVEKSEHGIPFALQVVSQPSIGWRAIVTAQGAVQTRFQFSAGDSQSLLPNLVLIAPIPQLQTRLQYLLYRARQLCFTRPGHFYHFAAAPEQMRHTRLVGSLGEAPVDSPSIPHQKPVKVRTQDRACLIVSATGLN
jgi:hypothetical protein